MTNDNKGIKVNKNETNIDTLDIFDDDVEEVTTETPEVIVSIENNLNEKRNVSKEKPTVYIYLRENVGADDLEERQDTVEEGDEDPYNEYFNQHGSGSNTH